MAIIPELPVKTTLNNSDVFVVDDGTHSYQVTLAVLNSMLAAVAGFTVDNTAGTITLTLSNGTVLTVTPHDPSKQDKLTFDSTPTANSTNPVTSAGIKSALDGKLNTSDYKLYTGASEGVTGSEGIVPAPGNTDLYLSSNGSWEQPDIAPTTNSKHLITSGAVKEALDNVTIEVDGALSPTSEHPVQNKVVYAALNGKADASIVNMIAETFSTSENYAVGKHVVYNGVLYIFTAAHTAGAWTGLDVETVDLATEIERTNNVINLLLESGFVLTAENYVPFMRLWFRLNGAAVMTDFNDLCEEWYNLTRTGWTGGTRFYHSTTSSVSSGTKVGDNANMTAVPSTESTAGQDDYQDVPLFHCLDCNWILDANGKPHITAIEGVCGDFERDNPDKLVGVIQMCGWHKYENDTTNGTYTHMYTDVVDADGYKPLPEAIDADGTYRSWVVHAKYAAGANYGCYSGVTPWTYSASHNTAITNFHTKWGNQYGGKTSADDAFLKLMFFIKYANLSADGILQGCVAYNYQYAVAVQETGVERVILTASQAANIKIGSTVMVGNPTAFSSGTTLNIDRGQAGMRAKVDRKKVTRKETLQSNNVAIYIDNGGVTFDTTANTISTTGDSPTYISTSPWYTGTCDKVKGVDGSPSTPGNGSEPVILQGIEYAMGAYEVVSDAILKYYKDSSDKYHLTVYICRDASKYATGITSDYDLVDYEVDCPASSSWQYIAELGYDSNHPEAWFPHLIGCTSSQRTKDAIYILATSTSTYEWLSLGHLLNGVGVGGLSIVNAGNGLSASSWHFLARLSATGTRGELAA